ncbi:hypothetical protein CROQUDRAFT_133464 [Cronartium quercuum f. sp. fusiforme G11]|uniref:Uncharacterized protein n=1 Tax=Cronartium quercuum f. sp. fusiforme G11 TaxID=708437 RepID=A0A9P6NFF2_9BASI|nr:hypothetical protein CROQUDRAFT_133464 [Cronartium quercuum f. sp. fusiforme G11]
MHGYKLGIQIWLGIYLSFVYRSLMMLEGEQLRNVAHLEQETSGSGTSISSQPQPMNRVYQLKVCEIFAESLVRCLKPYACPEEIESIENMADEYLKQSDVEFPEVLFQLIEEIAKESLLMAIRKSSSQTTYSIKNYFNRTPLPPVPISNERSWVEPSDYFPERGYLSHSSLRGYLGNRRTNYRCAYWIAVYKAYTNFSNQVNWLLVEGFQNRFTILELFDEEPKGSYENYVKLSHEDRSKFLLLQKQSAFNRDAKSRDLPERYPVKITKRPRKIKFLESTCVKCFSDLQNNIDVLSELCDIAREEPTLSNPSVVDDKSPYLDQWKQNLKQISEKDSRLATMSSRVTKFINFATNNFENKPAVKLLFLEMLQHICFRTGSDILPNAEEIERGVKYLILTVLFLEKMGSILSEAINRFPCSAKPDKKATIYRCMRYYWYFLTSQEELTTGVRMSPAEAASQSFQRTTFDLGQRYETYLLNNQSLADLFQRIPPKGSGWNRRLDGRYKRKRTPNAEPINPEPLESPGRSSFSQDAQPSSKSFRISRSPSVIPIKPERPSTNPIERQEPLSSQPARFPMPLIPSSTAASTPAPVRPSVLQPAPAAFVKKVRGDSVTVIKVRPSLPAQPQNSTPALAPDLHQEPIATSSGLVKDGPKASLCTSDPDSAITHPDRPEASSADRVEPPVKEKDQPSNHVLAPSSSQGEDPLYWFLGGTDLAHPNPNLTPEGAHASPYQLSNMMFESAIELYNTLSRDATVQDRLPWQKLFSDWTMWHRQDYIHRTAPHREPPPAWYRRQSSDEVMMNKMKWASSASDVQHPSSSTVQPSVGSTSHVPNLPAVNDELLKQETIIKFLEAQLEEQRARLSAQYKA